MLDHLRVAVLATLLLAVIVSGIYPLLVWGLAQALFPGKANGSLIRDKAGHVIGSSLIGQSFTEARYFHPRPSAAGNGYDATASGGSNLGPTSDKLINGTLKKDDKGNDVVDFDGIKLRTLLYAQENGIAVRVRSGPPLESFRNAQGGWDQVKLLKAFKDEKNPLVFQTQIPVPADAVTASGSGLDPHISVANARLQVARVAKARGLSQDQVQALVARFTEGPDLGILGNAGVNVLKLNLALDHANSSLATNN